MTAAVRCFLLPTACPPALSLPVAPCALTANFHPTSSPLSAPFWSKFVDCCKYQGASAPPSGLCHICVCTACGAKRDSKPKDTGSKISCRHDQEKSRNIQISRMKSLPRCAPIQLPAWAPPSPPLLLADAPGWQGWVRQHPGSLRWKRWWSGTAWLLATAPGLLSDWTAGTACPPARPPHPPCLLDVTLLSGLLQQHSLQHPALPPGPLRMAGPAEPAQQPPCAVRPPQRRLQPATYHLQQQRHWPGVVGPRLLLAAAHPRLRRRCAPATATPPQVMGAALPGRRAGA